MDIARIALPIGLICLAVAAVCVIGLLTQRRVARELPGSEGLKKMTPTGLVWSACAVAGFLGLMAARELATESALGQFLNAWYGLAVGYLVLGAVFNVAAALLGMYGHPIMEKDRGDA